MPKRFFDRDANLLVASFLSKNEVISLIEVNKRLKTDLYVSPFKSFTFDWCSDNNELLKSFINHSHGVEELFVDRHDFFHYLIDLPKLKKITIRSCSFPSFEVLDLYSETLNEVVIDCCEIEYNDLDLKKYPKLKKITIDPTRVETKKVKHSRKVTPVITLQTKPIDCYVIEID